MSQAQFRVLLILALAAGIDIGYNPTSRANLAAFLVSIGKADTPSELSYLQHIAAWGAGALAIVGIAAFAETAATWLALIILALTALTHGTQIAGTLDSLTSAATGQGAGEQPSHTVAQTPPAPIRRTTIG